jgi:hypothetical protein
MRGKLPTSVEHFATALANFSIGLVRAGIAEGPDSLEVLVVIVDEKETRCLLHVAVDFELESQ